MCCGRETTSSEWKLKSDNRANLPTAVHWALIQTRIIITVVYLLKIIGMIAFGAMHVAKKQPQAICYDYFTVEHVSQSLIYSRYGFAQWHFGYDILSNAIHLLISGTINIINIDGATHSGDFLLKMRLHKTLRHCWASAWYRWPNNDLTSCAWAVSSPTTTTSPFFTLLTSKLPDGERQFIRQEVWLH